jgi:hypothetical protein
MSYFRASTANNQGWRPGTVQGLGYMSSARENGPDWKTVAEQHAAASRAQQHHHRQRQRANDHRMAIVDAAARGDRTRVRTPRLSGLGSILSSATQMVNGAQYTFHFKKTGVTLGTTDMGALAATVAADGNFLTPVASDEPNGFQIRFIYNGPGTTGSDNVGNMGAEMQKVINDKNANGIGVFSQALFSSAEGGPLLTGGSGTPVFVGPDGIVRDASGNVISSNTSNPGDQSNNNNGGSSFSWPAFLEGMGLSVGVGTALAAGLAFLIFRD